jgi:hypothetical protein
MKRHMFKLNFLDKVLDRLAMEWMPLGVVLTRTEKNIVTEIEGEDA